MRTIVFALVLLLAKTADAQTIVCLGDSATAQTYLPDAERWTSKLQAALPSDTVINEGLNGNAGPDGVARFKHGVGSFADGA